MGGKLYDTWNDIVEELYDAEQDHPDWPDDLSWAFMILEEEVGETAQAILDWKFRKQPYCLIKKEMVQVAAMAIRFLINMEE